MTGGWQRLIVSVALLAALTVAARIPFLQRGDRFFDSDEAVEGLMARHVLAGERPLVLWGQHYKGVPEVYIAAAVFAAVGSSVTALKATTLGCFVVFVCLQFALVRRLLSERIAWIAALLLVAGPPSLVLWSLSGNAEIVFSMIAGALMLLAWFEWRASGSPAALAAAAASLGFGLWVHQYILYYVSALALAEWVSAEDRPRAVARLAGIQGGHTVARWWVTLCLAISALYIVLGAVAFWAGGFDAEIAGQSISVHHPQKMWQIAAGVLLLGAGARWLAVTRLSWPIILVSAGAFLAGYFPSLLQQLREGGGAPIAGMTWRDLAAAAPGMFGTAFPIVFGARTPSTEPLPGGALMLFAIAAALAFAYLRVGRAPTPFFHLFIVAAIGLFVVSGSYVDAQSYRYLMPLHAALPVLYALVADLAWRRGALAGTLAAAAFIGLFVWQQVSWYQRLAPDTHSALLLQCAAQRDIKYARAGYWLAYKLTFLSDETVIVAPMDGVDRYPLYTKAVVQHEPVPILLPPQASAGPAGCDTVIGLLH